jgi:uncharacterized protein
LSLAPLLLAVGLLAAPPTSTQGLEVPPNQGWVTDLAGLLTPAQESELEELMESYKQGAGHDVALLTVSELHGQPIERLALEVGRTWKLGDVGKDDSALLVVAKAERAVRIEVGRGSEGTLTDAISGRIVRDVIVPRFKEGRFYEGLRAGVEAIHAALGGDYAPVTNATPTGRHTAGNLLGPLVMILILFLILSSGGRGGRRRRRGSALPWILLGNALGSSGRGGGGGGGFGGGFGGGGGGGFSGFGGGGGFSGGGATGHW